MIVRHTSKNLQQMLKDFKVRLTIWERHALKAHVRFFFASLTWG